jgi:hypothetical protein
MAWDPTTCVAGKRHSGRDGARVRPELAYRWNRTAPRRWREIHPPGAAGHACYSTCTSWWAWRRLPSVQQPMPYVGHLHRLAHVHDFGFVDRGRRRGGSSRMLDRVPPRRAARSHAKYLAPVDGAKLTLTETVVRDDVPPLILYVSPKLTARSGVTMRSLRRRRYGWVIAREAGVEPDLAIFALKEVERLGNGARSSLTNAGTASFRPAKPLSISGQLDVRFGQVSIYDVRPDGCASARARGPVAGRSCLELMDRRPERIATDYPTRQRVALLHPMTTTAMASTAGCAGSRGAPSAVPT